MILIFSLVFSDKNENSNPDQKSNSSNRMKIQIQEQKVAKKKLYIATYNVRSLLGEDGLLELEEEVKQIK